MPEPPIEPPSDSAEPIAATDHRRCDADGCDEPMRFRVYASYNADQGENVHPLHARYPGAMYRSCPAHLTSLIERDVAAPLSTRQYIVVVIGD